jgi:hypothetical protein
VLGEVAALRDRRWRFLTIALVARFTDHLTAIVRGLEKRSEAAAYSQTMRSRIPHHPIVDLAVA